MNISQLAEVLTPKISSAGGVATLRLDPLSDSRYPDAFTAINAALQGAMPGAPPTLVLSNLQPPAPAPDSNNRITFRGTFSLYNNHPLNATIVFYLANSAADGTPQFTFSLEATATGTFSSIFPLLADTTIDTLAFDTPRFVLLSAPSDGTGQFPGAQAGLNFQGKLLTTSAVFSNITWLFTGTPTLQLTGPIGNVIAATATSATHAPAMALRTAAEAASLSWSGVRFQLWISAVAGEEPDLSDPNPAAMVAVADVRLCAEFAILSSTRTIRVPLEMYLSTTNSGLLSFGIDIGALLSDATTRDGIALNGLAELNTLAGSTALSTLIPSQYSLSTATLAIQELQIAVNPARRTITSLRFGLSVRNLSLTIVPALITLTEIGLNFTINQPLTPRLNNIFAELTGAFLIGDEAEIQMSVALPELTVRGYLRGGDVLSARGLLAHFLGQEVPVPNLVVTDFQLVADPRYGTFDLVTEVIADYEVNPQSPAAWTINLGISDVIRFDSLLFQISRSSTEYAVLFQSGITFLGIPFSVIAQKPAGRDWVFSGEMLGAMSIEWLATRVLPADWAAAIPAEVKSIALTQLRVAFDTTANTYAFAATISWPLQLGSRRFLITAALSLATTRARPSDPPQYSGQLSGSFSYNNLALEVGYRFGPNNRALYFQFNQLIVEYLAVTRQPPQRSTQQLLIRFGDLTVGAMLQFFVNLAAPGRQITLPAPWNALLAINLRNLALVVDFVESSIAIRYSANVNLGFIEIAAFEIVYTRQYGKSKVLIRTTGKFLDQEYKDGSPLQWDALNQPPPAVPGAGVQLIDIQYLGLGQHVALLNAPATMGGILDRLQTAVVPVDNAGQNPLAQTGALGFSSSSGWLIGARFVIMSTFSIGVIFNDPQLYGLQVAVNGPRAGVFQGLTFEILYRKIDETTGVFHVDLQLPAAIRQLEFGQVSVTLPRVVIDLYTNGNFRLNFGFPARTNDFSGSFGVQVFPFIGMGGFYFARLSGNTSSMVPQISNGSFSPVIEFGLALAIGVGKTINKGILSAGLSLTVQGTLLGVLAWFNPTAAGSRSDLYYWVQGTISIVGRIYGSVNFGPISANVSVTAYASAALTIESYRPIIIALSAGVSVQASVKIWFVRIHFSFNTTISESFTIGTTQPTPWRVIPGSPPPQRPATRALSAAQILAETLPAVSPPYALAMETALAEPKTTIRLVLTPAFSQGLSDGMLSRNGQSVPPAGSALVTCTLLLFVENAIDVAATSAEDVARFDTANADKPFNLLIGKLLRWVIGKAAGQTVNVTAVDLATIVAQMTQTAFLNANFSYEQLAQFCADNLVFEIRPRVGGEADISGTFFPMIPGLTLSDGHGLNVPFDSYSPTNATATDGSTYAEKLNLFLKLLDVEYASAVEERPDPNAPASASVSTAADPSMARYLFKSYFTMLTRTVAQAAVDLLGRYRYELRNTATLTLAQIAAAFPAGAVLYTVVQGDTLPYLERHFYVTEDELRAANGDAIDNLAPGLQLRIPQRVTPLGIITANQTADVLNPGATLPVDGVIYQVRAGDTLASIATALGVTASDLVGRNADTADLFSRGAAIGLGTVQYVVRSNDTPASIQAYFGVDAGALTPPNPTPGQTVTIANVVHRIAAEWVFGYVVATGDTLDAVITHYFPDASDAARRAEYAATIRSWNAALDLPADGTLTPGLVLQIPYALTFEHLAIYYLGLRLADLLRDGARANASLLQPGNINHPNLLALLAVLESPTIRHTIAAGDTFAGVAQRWGLTLEQLAAGDALVTQPNIFRAASPPLALTLPALPAIAIEQLIAALGTSGAFNTAAAQVSRFLLHGLQLPDPATFSLLPLATLANPAQLGAIGTFPLYALTGQEFIAPPESSIGYTLTLDNAAALPWVSFPGGNRLTFNNDELAQIAALRAAQFSPPISELAALPPYTNVPLRFALQQHQHWQAAALPSDTCLSALAGQAVQPCLLTLPDLLRAAVAAADGSLLYDLMIDSRQPGQPGGEVKPVACGFWATAIPFTVQRLADDPVAPDALHSTYLVKGADAAGKQTLLDLFTYLSSADGSSDQATLYLLYGAPQAEDGLRSDQIDRARTFLLKTNLSTLSHSDLEAAAARGVRGFTVPTIAAGLYDASLEPASSTSFIKLLWECSVVRSGGYYLDYQPSSADGPALPQYLFDSGGNATLTLLVLLRSQSAGGRTPLHRFNNRAVLGLHLDGESVFAQPPTYVVGSQRSLAAIAAAATDVPGVTAASLAVANQHQVNVLDPAASLTVNGAAYRIQPGDTLALIAARATPPQDVATIAGVAANQTAPIFRPGALLVFNDRQAAVQAVVRPGNIGFQLSRPNPVSGANTDDPTNLNNLFSLLTYQIAAGSGFLASPAAVPIGPTTGAQDHGDGLTTTPPDPAVWRYQQFLSPLRFLDPSAAGSALSTSPALPPASANPYAGIASGARVDLRLAFRDLYGNQIRQGLLDLPQIPLRFYDPLISIAAWPHVTSSFDVVSGEPQPWLRIFSDLKAAAYLPSPGTDYQAAIAAARADAEQFQRIYYQLTTLGQPPTLSTTLGQLATDETGATVGWQVGLALTTFVASIYRFLRAAQQVTPVLADVADGTPLADIAATYRVVIEALVVANRDLPLGAVFPLAGPGALVLQVPQYYTFQTGNTIFTIIGGDAGSLATLAASNADLPLRLNAVLIAGTRTYRGPDLSTETLLAIATGQQTTIADLAARNAGQPLRIGATLTLDGASLVVDSATNTLATAAAALQTTLRTRDGSTQSVSAVDVALANPLVVGVFDASAQLSFAAYVVDEGDTLRSVASKTGLADAAALLSLNYSATDPARNTPDLYPDGTAVWIKDVPYHVQTGDTFGSVAALFGLPPATLWQRNATARLKASSGTLVVPGHVSYAGSGYAVYQTTDSDTLAIIAARAGMSLADLVSLNHDVVGLLTLQPITLNGRQATPDQRSTLDTISQQLGLDLQSFAQQIAGLPIIRTWTMVLTAPPAVHDGGETLGDLVSRLNCTAAQLAEANSALCDLFDVSVAQQAQFPDRAPVTVGAHDTFATLAAAFGAPAVTVAALAAANPNLKLRSGAALLPVVRPVRYNARVTPGYPAPIFQVEVALTIARDPQLVPADVRGSAVEQVRATLTARPMADPGAPLGLEQFARLFEAAFGGLKLAKGADRDAQAAPGGDRRALWAVNFGQGKPGGFQFRPEGAPRFYALKPLFAMPWSSGDQTIAVPSYSHAAGLDPSTTTPRQYRNVNLDDWLRLLLSALDLFLSPRYAMPLYRLGATQQLTLAAVDAKQKVAQALRGLLDYLIVPPDQPDGYLEAAQEALYEQALVTLSSAFETDVLVQYPFAVDSPATSADTAPRLSGKPIADQYLTGHAVSGGNPVPETLDSVARAFGVSKGYVAQVLQHTRSLLLPGASVRYNGVAYAIADSSVTLADLAAHYQVDLPTLADGLTVVGDGPLFAAEVAINASRIVFPIAAGATFSSLADDFETTLRGVILANWDTAGIFAAGTSVRLSGQQTTVAAGDTPRAIAGRLSLGRDAFADALWAEDQQLSGSQDSSYTLQTGANLLGMQLLPQYSFSTAKLPLVDGTALATFLFNIKDEAAQRSVFLNLDYAVNELEYAIGQQTIEGYRESAWLTLIIPLAGDALAGGHTRIGQTEIPVLLRGFPTSPILAGQEWLPVADDASNKRWTYKLEFDEHQHTAQDSTLLHVGFNVVDDEAFASHMNPPQPPAEVVAALARFVTLYPAIQDDLQLLFAPSTPDNLAAIQRAATAFVTLVGEVATAWSPQTAPPPSNGHLHHTDIHEYRIDFLKNAPQDDHYAYLRLLTLDASHQERLWPAIVDDDSGAALAIVTQSPGQTVYRYPHDTSDPSDLSFRFDRLTSFNAQQPADALDVIRQQNGWSGACVQRNRALLRGSVTNEAFVYSSPMSLFSNRATPLLTDQRFVALNGDVSGPARDPLSLSAALSAFFQQLFTPIPAASAGLTTLTISVTVRYGYPLVAAPDALTSASLAELLNRNALSGGQLIITYVPQLLYPEYVFKLTDADGGPDWRDDPATFAGRLAAAVGQIAQSSGIAPETGVYVFDLAVYTTIQPQSRLPIVQRRNLFYSYLLLPAALPGGQVGVPYGGRLTAGGGVAPYRYAVTAGKLPPGLTLDEATGALSGKPTAAGGYTFTVRASDSNGQPRAGSQTYRVRIGLLLGPETLPDGQTNTPYRAQLAATGNTNPVSFTLIEGQLPPGLALDASGTIAGTPTAAGTWSVVISASETGVADPDLTRSTIRSTIAIGAVTLAQMAARLKSEGVALTPAAVQLHAAFPSAATPELARALTDAYALQPPRDAAALAIALKAASFDLLATSDGLQAVFPNLTLDQVREALTAAFVA